MAELKTTLEFGADCIDTAALSGWITVWYMVDDGLGRYVGRQIFDDLAEAKQFVRDNGGKL